MIALVRVAVPFLLVATVGALIIRETGPARESTPLIGQDRQQKSDSPGQEQKKKDEKKQESDGPLQLKKFMRAKLASSNHILEGLVTDDLKLVLKGSDSLLSMSRGEKWLASNDPLFRQYSMQFRNAVTRLKLKAQEGSLDGSALAWMDVTHSCLRCHEWLRNTVIVEQF